MNIFKYLGVAISEKGGSEETVRTRVSAAWDKWRDLSGVIRDKKMPRNFKKEEQIFEKTEMRMLRRIKGVTLRDKVKRVDIRKELGVNNIQEKVRKIRLRWYGHMQRMEEINEVRAIVDMMVPGKMTKRKTKRETKREMDGLRPKGHPETADHPGGCPGQNILEIKNSGR